MLHLRTVHIKQELKEHQEIQVKMADGLGREGNQFLFEKILE